MITSVEVSYTLVDTGTGVPVSIARLVDKTIKEKETTVVKGIKVGPLMDFISMQAVTQIRTGAIKVGTEIGYVRLTKDAISAINKIPPEELSLSLLPLT